MALLIADCQPSQMDGSKRKLGSVFDFVIVYRGNKILTFHSRNCKVESGSCAIGFVLRRDDFIRDVDDRATQDRRSEQLP